MRRWIVCGAVLVGVACIYFLFDPSHVQLFPKCPFLWLTGLKCPGCGSQRAIHSLLHGDVAAAAGYNFLLVISLPVLFVLLYAELFRTSRPRFYSQVHRSGYTWGYFSLVLLWWVGRNLFNW